MLLRNAITLCWTLSLLGACSAQPVLPPQVVPCPPPRISPELLHPARREAMQALDAYLDSLPTSGPSAVSTPTTGMLSKPN